MRIDKDLKTNSLNAAAKSAQTKSPKETAVEKQNMDVSDKVELSGKNIDISMLVAKVNAASSIRQDKVNSIKEAIQNGTYNVEGKLIARGLLKDNLLNEML